jgi:hypothetical protein
VLGICDDGDMHAGKGGESRSLARGAMPHDSSVLEDFLIRVDRGPGRFNWMRPHEMMRLAAALSCVMLASAFAPSVLPRAHVCPLDPRGLRIASHACMHVCQRHSCLRGERATAKGISCGALPLLRMPALFLGTITSSDQLSPLSRRLLLPLRSPPPSTV